MRVVAECYIECIIEDTPENIWYKTSDKSGVTKEFFDSYFEGFEKAYAIKLSNIHFFPESIPLSTFNLSRPPRLFQYVTM